MGLALRIVPRFESLSLVRALVGILKRLKEAGSGAYAIIMAGKEAAWAFSKAAVAWGNAEAKAWRNDMGYIAYLGSSHMRGRLP